MKPSGISEQIVIRAVSALTEIAAGKATLDEVLDSVSGTGLEFRRTLEHLLLNIYRRKCFLDGVVAGFASRPPAPELLALLESVLAQIYFQNAIAPQSAANIAVSLAKKMHADKFVNALLRRAVAEKVIPSDEPEAVFPPEIFRRWRRRFSAAELARLSAAFLGGAGFTFRMERDWPEPGFPCRPLASPAFRFFSGGSDAVLGSPEFAAGRIYIQDPAASLAPSLPDYSGVARALDLCAAPGGKALMVAEKLPEGAVLTVSDRSARRQERTRENFQKRNVPARIVTAEPEELRGLYDLVLADVPCSNTGVFRRRPDALWRFSGKALRETVALQKRILKEAARLTAPGGQLVYSTCSIEPEENEAAVSAFLESNPDFSCAAPHTLLPSAEGDGAFAALLRRK